VILGAGPAGLGAAYQLARRGFGHVTVLEQQGVVGGNAGSFELDGIAVDYGSHRLHPSCDPKILRDLRELLGSDLLNRPRHGRILLQGRWIHFPLKPLDLLLRLPPSFVLGVTADMVRKSVGGNTDHRETFASELERSLGRTICKNFYFPYARKLWGLPSEELSATQARRRVSANSFAKVLRKVASSIPGLKPPGAGRFFYPRHGYGEISARLYEAAKSLGVAVLLGARVVAVHRQNERVAAVAYEREGKQEIIPAQFVWSTLPISLLVRIVRPEPPSEVSEAASKICFRAMILLYLVLDQDRFTEYDAHYFPDEAVPVSRLSEPKNYSGSHEPRGRTVLCAEWPTHPGSREWQMSEQELSAQLCDALERVGLPIRAPIRQVVKRRLAHAYPIYRRGYEEHFRLMDEWLGGLEGLLTFGRQGLFAHDNTHHALAMAYSAVDCLGADGCFDARAWRACRQGFETHVVED
jgi:protoporphyrinogen oxidase